MFKTIRAPHFQDHAEYPEKNATPKFQMSGNPPNPDYRAVSERVAKAGRKWSIFSLS